jgi:hypothetical protein
MNRNLRILGLALLPLAGFGLAVLAGFVAAPARAGGVCSTTAAGTYVTSNQEGDTVYEWSLNGERASVTRYNFQSGKAIQKVLGFVSTAGGKAVRQPTEAGPVAEIVISGVIWTPDPANRVAIINGKTVREGEVFVTRSGKKYRVIEIKRSDEVEYREVKE